MNKFSILLKMHETISSYIFTDSKWMLGDSVFPNNFAVTSLSFGSGFSFFISFMFFFLSNIWVSIQIKNQIGDVNSNLLKLSN